MSRGQQYLENELQIKEREYYAKLQNSPTTPNFPTSPFERFPRPADSSLDTHPIIFARNCSGSTPVESRSRANSSSVRHGREPMGPHKMPDQSANYDKFFGQPQSGTSSSVSAGPPPTAEATATTGNTRKRGSLLVAASDALSLKFGRRRASIQQPPTPATVPNVLEIRPHANRVDVAADERDRQAARPTGLGSYGAARDLKAREDRLADEEVGDSSRHYYGARTNTGNMGLGLRNPDVAPSRLHASSVSVTNPTFQPQPAHVGRFRAGSVQAYSSPLNTKPMAPIPPFPSTITDIASFAQSAGQFPKYYPPSSLRMFALSKHWKDRYLVLSSPPTLVTQSRTPAVSYLHLFKTADPLEPEIERLEINEDSVVSVSEDEVGGRRHVIKVGGADVGALKKEYLHDEGGHVMWILQITDQATAQQWIRQIKSVILGQRTVRAGLTPHSFGNHEPQGDMDVMLSIRAQGLVTSSAPNATVRPSQNQASRPIPFQQTNPDPNYASSISSHSIRSHSTAPKTSPPNAVSALKGFFASGRPRSSSRATSVHSERPNEVTEGTFTSMGTNLLSMLRSSTPDTQSINTVHTAPPPPPPPVVLTNVPIMDISKLEYEMNRPIIPKPQSILWSTTQIMRPPSFEREEQDRPVALTPLPPPPRKRWTSTTPSNLKTNSTPPGNHSQNTPTAESSRRISFSTYTSKERANPHPLHPGLPLGPTFTRTASLRSVSTYASADKASTTEKSSLNTKRSSGTRSTRRWSRQSMIPNRTNPPSDSPPPVPHPHSDTQSHGSYKSFVSALPKFAKRQSGSSVQSFTSFSTTHSQTASILRPSSSSRNSMPPPPLPAPTAALPAAPVDSISDSHGDVSRPLEAGSASSIKSSYRNSVVNHSFRNSIVSPKPAPATNLPPRPDQPEYKAHLERSLGLYSEPSYSKLESIPASPVPEAKEFVSYLSSAEPSAAPRHRFSSLHDPPTRISAYPATTLKERLRNLSVSSAASNNQSHGTPTAVQFSSSGDTTSFLSTSSPPTPIGEKITTLTNDDFDLNPSFLHMHHTPPVMPTLSLPADEYLADPPPEEVYAVMTMLPPPPRRGSKHLIVSQNPPPEEESSVVTKLPLTRRVSNHVKDSEALISFAASIHQVPEGERPSTPIYTVPNYLSLSRPGSAMSRRSDRTEPAFEMDWDSPRDEISPTDSSLHRQFSF